MRTQLIIKKSQRATGGHSDIFLIIEKSSPFYKQYIDAYKTTEPLLVLDRHPNMFSDRPDGRFFEYLKNDINFKMFIPSDKNDLAIIGYITDTEIDNRLRTPKHACNSLGRVLKDNIDFFNADYYRRTEIRLNYIERAHNDLKEQVSQLQFLINNLIQKKA